MAADGVSRLYLHWRQPTQMPKRAIPKKWPLVICIDQRPLATTFLQLSFTRQDLTGEEIYRRGSLVRYTDVVRLAASGSPAAAVDSLTGRLGRTDQ
jgi:hypothetical protein